MTLTGAQSLARAIDIAATYEHDPDKISAAIEAIADSYQDRVATRDRIAARLRALHRADHDSRARLAATTQYPSKHAAADRQAIADVSALVEDVRELDPVDVWAAIQSWSPARVTAALVVAAAALSPTESLHHRLAWTETLA